MNTRGATKQARQPEGAYSARPGTGPAGRSIHRRIRGFTLIELMIVVVIVAILAAIALPSYLGQMRRSTGAEAQTYLTDLASRQQQFLVDRRAYAASVAALGVIAPANLTGKFDFTIAAANGPPPTFTLTATALGAQLHDQCPVLSINQAGERLPATCW